MLYEKKSVTIAFFSDKLLEHIQRAKNEAIKVFFVLLIKSTENVRLLKRL